MADAYLPVWITDLPAQFVFQPGGMLRLRVAEAVASGVVKVVAGPERCHVRVDIKRPYWRPEDSPSEAGVALVECHHG